MENTTAFVYAKSISFERCQKLYLWTHNSGLMFTISTHIISALGMRIMPYVQMWMTVCIWIKLNFICQCNLTWTQLKLKGS